MIEDIARIRQKLGLLFSDGTRYTPDQITRWEAAHQCELPDAYRIFLTELGECSYYPFGDLLPLSSWWDHLTDEDSCRSSLPWLQQDFDLPDHFSSGSAWKAWLADWQHAHPGNFPPWAGSIALTDDGCGMMSVLVV